MAGKILPIELGLLIGKVLRQARTSRKLSILAAAKVIGITTDRLGAIETGSISFTDIDAQIIVSKYGGARADRVDSILFQWAIDEVDRESKTKKRKHLSLVGIDPKPWEQSKKWR